MVNMGSNDKELLMDQQREQVMYEKRQRIMHAARRMIFVTFQKEGIHKYPAAATDPKLATGEIGRAHV